GRPFAAVWQFQAALAAEAAGTAEERIAATSRLAEALQRGRWYEPAARLLEPLAGAVPGDNAARQQLAGLYLTTGRPDQAGRLLISGAAGSRGALSPTAAVARVPPAPL